MGRNLSRRGRNCFSKPLHVVTLVYCKIPRSPQIKQIPGRRHEASKLCFVTTVTLLSINCYPEISAVWERIITHIHCILLGRPPLEHHELTGQAEIKCSCNYRGCVSSTFRMFIIAVLVSPCVNEEGCYFPTRTSKQNMPAL